MLFVKNGSVFKSETAAMAEGEKKEKEEAKGGNEILTGLEAADPDNPAPGSGVTADKDHLKKLRRKSSAATFTP
jgi:hypothetical protein